MKTKKEIQMKCVECGKPIPEYRKKAGKLMITCSKRCSTRRSLTSSKDRKK